MAQSALTSQFQLHPPLLVKTWWSRELVLTCSLNRASLFSLPCIQTRSCLPPPASSCLQIIKCLSLQGYFCWSTMNSEVISLLSTLSPTLGIQLASSLSRARFLDLTSCGRKDAGRSLSCRWQIEAHHPQELGSQGPHSPGVVNPYLSFIIYPVPHCNAGVQGKARTTSFLRNHHYFLPLQVLNLVLFLDLNQ